MAYSIDYRKAAIEYKQEGNTFAQLKKVFKITPKTYYEWVELLETTGSLQYRNASERKGKIELDELKKAVEEKPDLYLRELATQFGVSTTAIHKRLEKHKITYKKRRSLTPRNPKKTEHATSKN
jgi:transposase